MTSSERGRGASTSRDRADPPGPGREQHDAIGQEHGLGDRVGDEDDGRLRGLGDPLQLEVHLVARDRVERAERLVHEQDLGVVAQGPGDGDALAHAAGELARERLLEALQADELAQLVRAAPALGLVDLAQQQRQPDVLLDRVPGEEVGVLEDEAELAQRLIVAVIATPQRAPLIVTSPALGWVRPARIRSSVVLPQPDCPSSVTNSCLRMPRSMSVSARVSRLRALKRFETPRSSISASPSGSVPLTGDATSVSAGISLLEKCAISAQPCATNACPLARVSNSERQPSGGPSGASQ